MVNAIELADLVEDMFLTKESHNFVCSKAAAELRRLHGINAELLDALNNMLERCTISDPFTVEQARAAIEKATKV